MKSTLYRAWRCVSHGLMGYGIDEMLSYSFYEEIMQVHQVMKSEIIKEDGVLIISWRTTHNPRTILEPDFLALFLEVLYCKPSCVRVLNFKLRIRAFHWYINRRPMIRQWPEKWPRSHCFYPFLASDPNPICPFDNIIAWYS